ncbi:hypothetical protein G5S68_15745, partial [Legionella pneumophila serogroup 1]
ATRLLTDSYSTDGPSTLDGAVVAIIYCHKIKETQVSQNSTSLIRMEEMNRLEVCFVWLLRKNLLIHSKDKRTGDMNLL